MDAISICISTYGDRKWERLAKSRALPSAQRQKADEIVMVHLDNGTAASCKNVAIEKAKGPWIICLDADDELEEGYAEAMRNGAGDLRYPLVRKIPADHPDTVAYPDPVNLKHRNSTGDLLLGNWMVIGSMFRRDDFLKVGGFREFESWEDWFLYMQLTYCGAVPVLCPGAVYRVFEHQNSRVTVPDPMKLFLSMQQQFREWALAFNGGQTNHPGYRKFIARTGYMGGAQ
jgi:glycosyltransferase involved in cell wall biosynthesis